MSAHVYTHPRPGPSAQLWRYAVMICAAAVALGMTIPGATAQEEPSDLVSLSLEQLAISPGITHGIKCTSVRTSTCRAHGMDAALYHASELENQAVPSYTRIDLRTGWRPIYSVQLSARIQNLFDHRHVDLGTRSSANWPRKSNADSTAP